MLPAVLATVALALHFKELLLRCPTILFNLLKSRGSINAHQYAKKRGEEGGEKKTKFIKKDVKLPTVFMFLLLSLFPLLILLHLAVTTHNRLRVPPECLILSHKSGHFAFDLRFSFDFGF